MKNSLQQQLLTFADEKGYTLDYLSSGSPIFQVKDLYTFTSDSIALAHSVKEDEIDHLVDLCSGSGVVGFEVSGNKVVKNLTLVELQKELADASRLSAEYFLKETNIKVVNDNIKNLDAYIENESVDVVLCNPPYFKRGSGEVGSNQSRAMARHEVYLILDDIVYEAGRILKSNGKFYLIHLSSRLNEIEKALTKYGFNIVSKNILKGKLERVIIESKKQ